MWYELLVYRVDLYGQYDMPSSEASSFEERPCSVTFFPHKAIENADVLPPFSSVLVGDFDVDCLDKFPPGIRDTVTVLFIRYIYSSADK